MCPCPPKLQTQVPQNAKTESWHVMIFNIFVTVLVTVSAAIHWGPRCNAKIRQGCKQRRHPQTCSTHWSKHIKHIRTYLQVTASHNRSHRARLTLNHSGCKQNASPQWLSPAIPSLQRGKSGYLSPMCKCYQAFICVILCLILCSIVQLLCFQDSLLFAAKSKGRSLVDSCLCGKWFS
jgi:hypothetical protein